MGTKSKMIWTVINDILVNTEKTLSVPKTKDYNGNSVNQPREIANVFNKYYVNVGNQLASQISHHSNIIFSLRVTHSFALFDTTSDKISKLISGLNIKKGNRVNDIPTKIIKLSNQVISPF